MGNNDKRRIRTAFWTVIYWTACVGHSVTAWLAARFASLGLTAGGKLIALKNETGGTP
jgi:hypothetical protein